MKCFTIQAERQILLAPSFHTPMTMIAPELYPKARTGIIVNKDANEIELAPGMKAEVAPELIQQGKPLPNSPHSVLIERASLSRTGSGALLLKPEETDDDNESALVFLDLGRGSYTSVSYEVGNRVLLRARKCADVAFGVEETALVEVPKGRPFAAYRSSKRFFCFGGDVVGEQLQVKFDGKSLSCDPVRADHG